MRVKNLKILIYAVFTLMLLLNKILNIKNDTKKNDNIQVDEVKRPTNNNYLIYYLF